MTPREQRVQNAVEAMSNVLATHDLPLDDMVSAIFSMALRIVLALKSMGADMQILQGGVMRLLAECAPVSKERMN